MSDTTTKELDRLADWLRAQGMTPAQVLDCLKYIAGTAEPIPAPTSTAPTETAEE